MPLINKKTTLVSLFVTLCLVGPKNSHAQNVHSDNGDGTYTNPLISADFPDPDVIQVGDTLYGQHYHVCISGRTGFEIA